MIYLPEDGWFDILASRGLDASKLEEVYDCLVYSDYRVRTLAAQTIQMRYATKKSFKVAKKMTKSKKWEHREIGAYILGQLGSPKTPFIKESLPILIKLFKDKNDDVVTAAISSVGHLLGSSKLPYNKKLVQKIISYSNHKNHDIRISSVMALASFKYTKKIKKCLKKALKDKNKDVREWAELALEILEDR